MKHKKVVIIGGGFVGLITANYLLSKGIKNISIYELKNNLGGILKDEIINNDFFFKSCQYLDVYSKYYEYIPKKVKKNLHVFNHEYFSITKFKKKNIFTKNFAGPVFDVRPSFKKKKNLEVSLLDRLSIYPLDVSSFLINWVRSASKNIDKLTSQSSYSLYVRRPLFRNFIDDIKKNKKIKYIDETHGLPRNILKLPNIKAALPSDGFDNFFLQFEKHLINRGVSIHKKNPIKIFFPKKNINIYTGLNKINFDHIVWTGNPTAIIKNILKKKLDSFNIKSVSYYFNIKKI